MESPADEQTIEKNANGYVASGVDVLVPKEPSDVKQGTEDGENEDNKDTSSDVRKSGQTAGLENNHHVSEKGEIFEGSNKVTANDKSEMAANVDGEGNVAKKDGTLDNNGEKVTMDYEDKTTKDEHIGTGGVNVTSDGGSAANEGKIVGNGAKNVATKEGVVVNDSASVASSKGIVAKGVGNVISNDENIHTTSEIIFDKDISVCDGQGDDASKCATAVSGSENAIGVESEDPCKENTDCQETKLAETTKTVLHGKQIESSINDKTKSELLTTEVDKELAILKHVDTSQVVTETNEIHAAEGTDTKSLSDDKGREKRGASCEKMDHDVGDKISSEIDHGTKEKVNEKEDLYNDVSLVRGDTGSHVASETQKENTVEDKAIEENKLVELSEDKTTKDGAGHRSEGKIPTAETEAGGSCPTEEIATDVQDKTVGVKGAEAVSSIKDKADEEIQLDSVVEPSKNLEVHTEAQVPEESKVSGDVETAEKSIEVSKVGCESGENVGDETQVESAELRTLSEGGRAGDGYGRETEREFEAVKENLNEEEGNEETISSNKVGASEAEAGDSSETKDNTPDGEGYRGKAETKDQTGEVDLRTTVDVEGQNTDVDVATRGNKSGIIDEGTVAEPKDESGEAGAGTAVETKGQNDAVDIVKTAEIKEQSGDVETEDKIGDSEMATTIETEDPVGEADMVTAVETKGQLDEAGVTTSVETKDQVIKTDVPTAVETKDQGGETDRTKAGETKDQVSEAEVVTAVETKDQTGEADGTTARETKDQVSEAEVVTVVETKDQGGETDRTKAGETKDQVSEAEVVTAVETKDQTGEADGTTARETKDQVSEAEVVTVVETKDQTGEVDGTTVGETKDQAGEAEAVTAVETKDQTGEADGTTAGETKNQVGEADGTTAGETKGQVGEADRTTAVETKDQVSEADGTTAGETKDQVGEADVTTAAETKDQVGEVGGMTAGETKDQVGEADGTTAGETKDQVGEADMTTAGEMKDQVGEAGRTTAVETTDQVGEADGTTAGETKDQVGEADRTTAAETKDQVSEADRTTAGEAKDQVGEADVTTAGETKDQVGEADVTTAGEMKDQVSEADGTTAGETKSQVGEADGMTAGETKDQVGEADGTTAVETKDQVGEAETITAGKTKDQTGEAEVTTAGETKDEVSDADVSTAVATKDQVGKSDMVTAGETKDQVGEADVVTAGETKDQVGEADGTTVVETKDQVGEADVVTADETKDQVGEVDVVTAVETKDQVGEADVATAGETKDQVGDVDVATAGETKDQVGEVDVVTAGETKDQVGEADGTTAVETKDQVGEADVVTAEETKDQVGEADGTKAGETKDQLSEAEVVTAVETKDQIGEDEVTTAVENKDQVGEADVTAVAATKAKTDESDATTAVETENQVGEAEVTTVVETEDQVGKGEVVTASKIKDQGGEVDLVKTVETKDQAGEADATKALAAKDQSGDVDVGTAIKTKGQIGDTDMETTVETKDQTADADVGTEVQTKDQIGDVDVAKPVATKDQSSQVDVEVAVETENQIGDVAGRTAGEAKDLSSDADVTTTIQGEDQQVNMDVKLESVIRTNKELAQEDLVDPEKIGEESEVTVFESETSDGISAEVTTLKENTVEERKHAEKESLSKATKPEEITGTGIAEIKDSIEQETEGGPSTERQIKTDEDISKTASGVEMAKGSELLQTTGIAEKQEVFVTEMERVVVASLSSEEPASLVSDSEKVELVEKENELEATEEIIAEELVPATYKTAQVTDDDAENPITKNDLSEAKKTVTTIGREKCSKDVTEDAAHGIPGEVIEKPTAQITTTPTAKEDKEKKGALENMGDYAIVGFSMGYTKKTEAQINEPKEPTKMQQIETYPPASISPSRTTIIAMKSENLEEKIQPIEVSVEKETFVDKEGTDSDAFTNLVDKEKTVDSIKFNKEEEERGMKDESIPTEVNKEFPPDKSLNAFKEVDGFIWVESQETKLKSDQDAEGICYEATINKVEVKEIEDGYETDFDESEGEHEIPGTANRGGDVTEEKHAMEQTDKHIKVDKKQENPVTLEADVDGEVSEPEVVEISLQFLELLEGFCMAVSQEFPSDLVDFAFRYFTRISEKRKEFRKNSIEVPDHVLFLEMDWNGTI